MDFSKINWRKYGDYTKLDMFGCVFSIQDLPDVDRADVKFRILAFSCNDVALNSRTDDYVDGPFWFKLDHAINLPCKDVRSTHWDEQDKILYINNLPYKLIDTNFVYFLSDFHAQEDQAISSVMEYFAKDILENKIL